MEIYSEKLSRFRQICPGFLQRIDKKSSNSTTLIFFSQKCFQGFISKISQELLPKSYLRFFLQGINRGRNSRITLGAPPTFISKGKISIFFLIPAPASEQVKWPKVQLEMKIRQQSGCRWIHLMIVLQEYQKKVSINHRLENKREQRSLF